METFVPAIVILISAILIHMSLSMWQAHSERIKREREDTGWKYGA